MDQSSALDGAVSVISKSDASNVDFEHADTSVARIEENRHYPTLSRVLTAVRQCRACEQHLPLGPRPLLQVNEEARILIVGQAPGSRAHATGIPWNDPSGDRLRSWMGIDAACFYDAKKIAIIPMGYCYPGRGNGGDLPPRRECARLWLHHLLVKLPRIEITLLVGLHAQRHFLGDQCKQSLTETVKAWRDYAPAYLPLPHSSPRNTPWLHRNRWFEHELVPVLRKQTMSLFERHVIEGLTGPGS